MIFYTRVYVLAYINYDNVSDNLAPLLGSREAWKLESGKLRAEKGKAKGIQLASGRCI